MSTQRLEQNPLATSPIGKLILKFSVPCIIAMLVNSLYNIVDQIFIGRGVGFLGNGATNVIFPITVVGLALSLLIGEGAAAYYSLKMGAGDAGRARKGLGNAIVVLAGVGVLFTLACGASLELLVDWLGATEAIRPYALEYGGIIILGFPLVVVGTGLNSIIRACGAPAYAMKSMILGAVINTILDPLFIFPLQMGVRGAAIATVIGQAASFAMSVWFFQRRGEVRLTRADFTLERSVTASVFGCGVASFINQMAITLIMVVTNVTLVRYGAESSYGAEIPLTVVGIVMKVNQIVVSILVGLAVGAQPILGFNYGAGDMARVKKTFVVAVALATLVSGLAFIVFMFFPQAIVDIFGAEDDLYNEFARKAFRIFLSLCLLNGFQTTVGVFFQATGRAAKATLVSLSRQVVFMVPAVMLLPAALGVDGVLWAGPLADGLAFVLAFAMIRSEAGLSKSAVPAPLADRERTVAV